MGIISAKNRIGGRAIQTDANISPANYGGPLVDIQGRLIGICVPMNPRSQGVAAGVEWYDSGIGFAVPVDDFAKIIERLKDGRKILPAFVGIATTSTADGVGMQVFGVTEGSAAEKAGMIAGYILLTINDVPINDMLRLRQVLNRFEAGQEISVSLNRLETPADKKAKKKADTKFELIEFKMVLGAYVDESPKLPGEQEAEKPKVR